MIEMMCRECERIITKRILYRFEQLARNKEPNSELTDYEEGYINALNNILKDLEK